MVKTKAIQHINTILKSHSWGTVFGHSFRISGACFYLSEKIDLKIICITGRWHSLGYEVYICTFEQVTLHHFGGLLAWLWATSLLVGCASQIYCRSFVVLWVSGYLCSTFQIKLNLTSHPTYQLRVWLHSQRQIRLEWAQSWPPLACWSKLATASSRVTSTWLLTIFSRLEHSWFTQYPHFYFLSFIPPATPNVKFHLHLPILIHLLLPSYSFDH